MNRIYLPFRKGQIVLIEDPDLVEYILKTNFLNYEKGDFLRDLFRDFLGDGIFNSDGENWKKQRATASHLFSIRELKSMVEVFTKHGKSVVDILLNLPNDQVEIQDLFQRYTLDSFGEIALGVDIGSLHSKGNQLSLCNPCRYSFCSCF